MEMDIDPDDLDLDLDPLNALFRHKLDQAKILKSEMQSTLTSLNELLLNLQKDCCNISKAIEICDNWKGVYNGKFVILIKLENKLQSGLHDFNVILNWKPAITPLYEIKIYDIGSKSFTKEIYKQAIAVLLIERPSFTRYVSYEAQGTLVYKVENSNFQLQLPKISMNIKDYGLEIKNINLFGGNFNMILSVLSSLTKIKLILQLRGSAERKLENYLTIDCMLREIVFDGVKYYVFDGISDTLDGSLIKYNEENKFYVIEVYYRKLDNLYSIIHYLYNNINGLTVLPNRFKENLEDFNLEFENFTSSQAYATQVPKQADPNLKLFTQSLQKQIKSVSDFYDANIGKSVSNSEDVSKQYSKLRALLTLDELETDLLYTKLSN